MGPLPRKLAGNLAQLDLTYRDGWRVDPSTKVARQVPARRGEASDPALAFRLLVPAAFAAQANAEAAHHTSASVRIDARDDLDQAVLVRPDGYIAGRSAPADLASLLDSLDRALSPSAANLMSAIR